MTVIALPSGHEHLANALVRDCGFVKVHVDESLRRLALAVDPLVEAGVTLVNMGRSPRLSSRLAEYQGDWGLLQARVPEVTRFLEALRTEIGEEDAHPYDCDTVIVGVVSAAHRRSVEHVAHFVAIDGRYANIDPGDEPVPDCHIIPEGSIVDQEIAIVRYVRDLKTASPADPFTIKPSIVSYDVARIMAYDGTAKSTVATPDETTTE